MTNRLSLPQTSLMRRAEFTYGVATSSFQIEGAADAREASIWDTFCAVPGNISDGSDGNVACDHVRLWKEDVELIHSLGVDAYRFSVSWPRVINRNGKVNTQGLQFYIDLLDALNEKGIKPFVTLYHWDLPQYLEEQGGWLNRQTAYRFQEYADTVVSAFGDRVYSYATLNEPFCSAFLGYELGVHAPGKTERRFGRQAAHHLLLAHGLAMQVLQEKSPHSLNGIVLNFSPAYPFSDSDADRRAVNFADEYHNHWYLQPLLEGRYPEVIKLLSENDRPVVEAGDMELIAQPLDFLGVNYYTHNVYKATPESDYLEVPPDTGEITDMGWRVAPASFTDLLVSLNEQYRLPPVYITENGAAMKDILDGGQVQDTQRIAYYQSHLNALHDAIEQGVDVRGYFAWSLMDNFEWAEGYEKRFGIVYVDFITQQRTLKNSAIAYRDLITNRN